MPTYNPKVALCKRCGMGFDVDNRDPRPIPAMHGKNKWAYDLSDHCTPCWFVLLKEADLWNGLTCRFHWIAFTSRQKRYELFEAVARLVYGAAPDVAQSLFRDTGHGRSGYKSLAIGPHAVALAFSDDRDDVHVVIPGCACDQMPIANILQMFRLPDATFKRVDVAIDGVLKDGKPLDPGWLHGLCFDHPEQVRTRTKMTPSRDPLTGNFPENLTLIWGRNGKTMYLGSKDSDRYIRVYDSRGFTRIELQSTDDEAQLLADVFEGRRAEDVPEQIVGLLRRFVDFIEPTSPQKTRCKLQEWWRVLVEGADKILCSVQRKKPTLDSSWRYFIKQWSAFLATSLKASGGDYDTLFKLVDEGTNKMTARHEQMIREAGGMGGWVPSWQ